MYHVLQLVILHYLSQLDASFSFRVSLSVLQPHLCRRRSIYSISIISILVFSASTPHSFFRPRAENRANLDKLLVPKRPKTALSKAPRKWVSSIRRVVSSQTDGVPTTSPDKTVGPWSCPSSECYRDCTLIAGKGGYHWLPSHFQDKRGDVARNQSSPSDSEPNTYLRTWSTGNRKSWLFF